MHEILVSEEEAHRTVERGPYYAILPMLPELRTNGSKATSLAKEYSSADNLMNLEETTQLLRNQKLMPEDVFGDFAEVLR